MTAQGSSRAVFRRAIDRGNVVVAEITARELGRLDLGEALELAALIAKHDPRVRGRRATARWLRRWLEQAGSPTIDDTLMVAGNLAALGGEAHGSALAVLREVSRRVGKR